jgi:hypothetical protein
VQRPDKRHSTTISRIDIDWNSDFQLAFSTNLFVNRVLGSAAIGGGIAAVLGFFARAPRTQTQSADTGRPLDTDEARH